MLIIDLIAMFLFGLMAISSVIVFIMGIVWTIYFIKHDKKYDASFTFFSAVPIILFPIIPMLMSIGHNASISDSKALVIIILSIGHLICSIFYIKSRIEIFHLIEEPEYIRKDVPQRIVPNNGSTGHKEHCEICGKPTSINYGNAYHTYCKYCV